MWYPLAFPTKRRSSDQPEAARHPAGTDHHKAIPLMVGNRYPSPYVGGCHLARPGRSLLRIPRTKIGRDVR